jgi:hypothetical protein
MEEEMNCVAGILVMNMGYSHNAGPKMNENITLFSELNVCGSFCNQGQRFAYVCILKSATYSYNKCHWI